MNRHSQTLACIYLYLSIYSIGGAVVEGVVYYPAWKTVGPAEFPTYHRSLSDHLLPAFVFPFFLSVVANELLACWPPKGFPRPVVHLALALNVLIVVVTVAIAVPIQFRLAEGQSIPEIDRLILVDRALRLPPGLIVGVLNGFMLTCLGGQSCLRPHPARFVEAWRHRIELHVLWFRHSSRTKRHVPPSASGGTLQVLPDAQPA